MTDLADYAQPLEERERRHSIAQQAARAARSEHPREIDGQRVCLDCDEPLDSDRLQANPDAVRCVECQQRHEQLQRMGRR